MVPEQVRLQMTCDTLRWLTACRRAKIKNIAKRSIESGEDCDSIPDSMRQYLAMQAYGPGKGLPGSLLGRGGMPYGSGTLCLNTDTSTGKVGE